MVASRALVSDRWSRGTETGTRLQCKLTQVRQQCCHSNINSGIELRVVMIKNLNQSLWLHITIHSTPLLPPSFDLGFEFALRDVHVTAEVAVDIINGSFY